MEKEKKKIEFTDDQYKVLVKLLFYGEWLLNANKIGYEEMDKGASELVEYVYAKKGNFSLQKWFKELKYGEELKEPVTLLLLEKVFEYNEDTFWIYLIKKLSLRDAMKEHLEKGGKITNKKEIAELQWKYEEKYEDLFKERKIDALLTKRE